MASDFLPQNKKPESGDDLADRIADLSPAKRVLLELKLKQRGSPVSNEQPTPRIIPRRADRHTAPLSFAQQRLWFLDQLEPHSPLYNISRAVHLRGTLDVGVLQNTLNALVSRHEALRTTVAAVDGIPVQVIAPSQTVELMVHDLRAELVEDRQAAVQQFLTAEARRPFNLTRDLMLRATLLQLAEQEHVLLLVMHHITSDGWSMGILFRELTTCYNAFVNNQPFPLSPLPVQYADYAVWQRQWLRGEELTKQVTYWRQRLAGAPPLLELPTGDYSRPAVQTYHGACHLFRLPQILTEELKILSHQAGVTLFMTLLAAFQTLLHRYTSQNDIIVGSPIAGRTRTETEDLIGFFVNTLVLRTDLSGNPTFWELLKRVREVCLGAYAHQELPFENLVEELQPVRTLSYAPLFQVLFALRNVPRQALELEGLMANPVDIDNRTAKFDLSVVLQEEGEGLQGIVEYSSDLFEASTIARMLGHYQTVLEGIVANPDARITTLPLLITAERHQLLVEWNATQCEYPHEQCLPQLFEAQVARTPDALAVVFEEQQTTYRELNRRTNQLAHYLWKLGVGPEVLVGLCMERSLEMVVGLLGILKAGGAYVPLDPTYPRERLAFMLEDTQAPVLLTQQRLVAGLPEHGARLVCLDTAWEVIARESEEPPINGATVDNLAYVMYTSGSTGKPKGVLNTHRGICNRLLWMQEAYPLTAADRVLQKTPFSFDVSVWEFFWPLLAGARLVVARPGGHQDSTYLLKLITTQQITTLHFVPPMLGVFLDEEELQYCRSLRHVFCSGEVLSWELQEQFFARLGEVELHNLYGPTEAAIDVTAWACQRASQRHSVPIGRPIANTQIYILDAHLQPVPIGIPGELHISGVGLARGYLNQPELTAEKFIANPFSPDPSARLYKTGDRARYRPDGNIEFLGRLDHQVKLRGFRIELGEIETVLSQHSAVREVVVTVREDTPGDKRLVAYVVCTPAQSFSPSELRRFLQAKLPEYMVPAIFLVLDVLPLTPNGKVDRRALPAPEHTRPRLEREFVAPRTPVEEVVAEIWTEVLGVERVGIHDNFFALGGHSLLATQVMARIRRTLPLDPPLRTLFEAPTIAGLAEAIIRRLAEQADSEKLVSLVAELEASSGEKALDGPTDDNSTD